MIFASSTLIEKLRCSNLIQYNKSIHTKIVLLKRQIQSIKGSFSVLVMAKTCLNFSLTNLGLNKATNAVRCYGKGHV